MRVTLPERVVGVKDAIFILEVEFPAAIRRAQDSGAQTVVVEASGPVEPMDLGGNVASGTYDLDEGLAGLHIPIRVVRELERNADASLVVRWSRAGSDTESVERTMTIVPASAVPHTGSGAKLGFVAVLLAALAVLGFWVLPGLFGGPEVPDASGLSVAEARAALEGAGFAVRVQPTPVRRWGEHGVVLRTRPAAGERAKAGSTVELSVGAYRVPMPDVVGMLREEAFDLLRADGLQVMAHFDDGAPPEEVGLVTSQSPSSGEAVSPASIVRLQIGLGPIKTIGPRPAPVIPAKAPSVADPRPEDPFAEEPVAQEPPSKGPIPGDPIPSEQTPAEDPSPAQGHFVVPAVVGVERLRAATLVKNAGLRARIELDTKSGGQPGIVLAQDPAPGTKLERGARVILYVAR